MRLKAEQLYDLQWKVGAGKWTKESGLSEKSVSKRRSELLSANACLLGPCVFPFSDCDSGIEIHVTKV